MNQEKERTAFIDDLIRKIEEEERKEKELDMMFDVSDEFAQELLKNKKEGSAYKLIGGVVKAKIH
ncbi:hypothetical protein N9Y89_02010 [bacterium]|nr:hypothetical protein [bacterium]